jgi:tetratricopeptide (TPR) repeat protein
MAPKALNESLVPQSVFREHILTNLQYWHDYVTGQATEVSRLDRGRNRIVTAILFALDFEEVWPGLAELIETFSSYMERRGHWETWQGVLSRALETMGRSNRPVYEITLTVLLARLLQRQGRSEEAVACYRRVIRLARRHEDPFNEARACSNLGYLYINRGSWRRAEVLCCHALAIFEPLGSDYGRAHTENHLGILYTHQHRWAEAQRHLDEACRIWQRIEDDHGLMRGFINLGHLYNQKGAVDRAISYHEKALHQAKLVGEEAETGMILINMAIAQKKGGDLASAASSLEQAETIFQRLAAEKGLALVWHNRGWLCVDQQQWPDAKFYLETALAAARQLDDDYLEIETLIGLVKYEIGGGSQAGAIAKLEALGQFINRHPQYETYRAHYRQLAQDCRSLPALSTRQAAAG